jgi:hypothetical protein
LVQRGETRGGDVIFWCECGHKFRGRAIANVLHAPAVFQADLNAVAVDEGLAAQLAEIAEREARKMNPQDVANTYNALCKLEAVDEIGLLLTSTRCPVETHLTATTSV